MKLVIGLGGIGGNMALRLRDVGMAVAGLDPAQERTRAWRSSGAQHQGFTRAEEVPWPEVSHVVVAVRTEEQLDDVLREVSDKLADQPTSIVVVSTISVERAARLQEGIPRNWRMMEAPVSGGEESARRGSLSMFIHAPVRTDEDDRLVAALSSTRYRFDEPGQATYVKLMNNAVAAYNARGMALAMRIGESVNVPGKVLLDAIGKSSGASFAGNHLMQLSDNQLDLLEKDVGLLGRESPAQALIQQLEGWRDAVAGARADRVNDDSGL